MKKVTGTIFLHFCVLSHHSFSCSFSAAWPQFLCVCVCVCVSPPRLYVSLSAREMDARVPLSVLRRRVSPLLGLSAPAYCDIVPLFSQSIVFNRTMAQQPNWKGLQPTFHQIHNRVGCRVHRAAEATQASTRFLFLPTFTLASFFHAAWLQQEDFAGNK